MSELGRAYHWVQARTDKTVDKKERNTRIFQTSDSLGLTDTW